MALAVLPCPPHSPAAVRVSAAMPALAALYSPRPAAPRSAARDTLLTTRPQLRAAMSGRAAHTGHRRPRPRAREHQRSPPTDALAAAGDECDPTGEPVHRVRRARRAGAPCASSRCLRGSLRRTLTLRLVRGQATEQGRTARSLYGKRSAFFVVRRLMVARVHRAPTRPVTRLPRPSLARRLPALPCA